MIPIILSYVMNPVKYFCERFFLSFFLAFHAAFSKIENFKALIKAGNNGKRYKKWVLKWAIVNRMRLFVDGI